MSVVFAGIGVRVTVVGDAVYSGGGAWRRGSRRRWCLTGRQTRHGRCIEQPVVADCNMGDGLEKKHIAREMDETES